MDKQKTFRVALLGLILLAACESGGRTRFDNDPEKESSTLRLAVMADVHFHDVYADTLRGPLASGDDGSTRPVAIRTMESQLNSTRLFNENYFAFRAALDDAVGRGIRLVALAGDFSDDGQPVHVRKLAEVLDHYRETHGVRFFATTGNHDPNRPYDRDAGKADYLGEDGRPQPIFSTGHPACRPGSSGNSPPNRPEPLPVFCTDEVREMGYEGLLDAMRSHGFFPDREDLYFETPFSRYGYSNYTYEAAAEEAVLDGRVHEICREGTGGPWKRPHYTNCFEVPDASYLVEPVPDLWLLMLDANVYRPVEDADGSAPKSPANFGGAGDAGFNSVVTHKEYLLDWIGDVAKRAESKGKALVAVSHYPMVRFFSPSREQVELARGDARYQTARMPSEETSRRLADTGLRLHIGGHMHMNNTAFIRGREAGRFLFDIQVPSLAAYAPAYKSFSFGSPNGVEVRTIVLRDVPDFNDLFEHYRTEWEYLDSIGYDRIWRRQVLESGSYYEFVDWHLRELTRLRFLPNEWPADIRLMLRTMSGREILIASLLDGSFVLDRCERLIPEGRDGIWERSGAFSEAWRIAEERASRVAEESGFALADFGAWRGEDLAVDFYRLRNAGSLALPDIPRRRLAQYRRIGEVLRESIAPGAETREKTVGDCFTTRFEILFDLMGRFADRPPDDRFHLDLESGGVRDLSSTENPLIE